MDLTGLKYDLQLFRMILGPMKCLSEFMSEHYVEIIKYFLIVNVPTYMNIIWNFTKPLLPIRTRDKVGEPDYLLSMRNITRNLSGEENPIEEAYVNFWIILQQIINSRWSSYLEFFYVMSEWKILKERRKQLL